MLDQSRRRNPRRRHHDRRLLVQLLEDRVLLASDWTNQCNAYDTSEDGIITPLDALLPINQIRRIGVGSLPDPRPDSSPRVDANSNGTLEPRDALVVINQLMRANQKWDVLVNTQLQHDSGLSASDGISNQGIVSGAISASLGFDSIRASVDGQPSVEVAPSCNGFTFDPGFASDGSDDGTHSIVFTIGNSQYGEVHEEVTLQLDTVGPFITATISAEDDSGIIGDNATSNDVISIVGTTEPSRLVEIVGASEQTMADENGRFVLAVDQLVLGPQEVTVQATDLAGNTSVVQTDIVSTPCDFHDDLTVGVIDAVEIPSAGDVIGTVDLDQPSLPLTSISNGQVQRSVSLLNQDFDNDLVVLKQSTNEVLVYLGDREGNWRPPRRTLVEHPTRLR